MSDKEFKFRSDAEIRELVEAFEACSFHPADFKHHQHLTVALFYVRSFAFDDASERTKNGIRRLAETYGKTGYHETITIFWLRVVRGFLTGVDRSESIAALANQLVQKYADKNLVFEYYSPELLTSEKAKSEWVEPDLKPLDF